MSTGASPFVAGEHVARKLQIWKRARKVTVRQEDGNCVRGIFVMHTSFKVIDSSALTGKFAIDTEVLDIGNRDVILGLFWLMENGFSVDTQNRYLRNVNSGQLIPTSVRWIR